MPRRRLLWQLYPIYLVITLAAFLTASLYAARDLRTFYHEYVARDLASRAVLAAEVIGPLLDSEGADKLEVYCKDLAAKADVRLTVIQPDGRVIAESHRDPSSLENHASRPEIKTAFGGDVGSSERYSTTLRDRLLYVAVPIKKDGRVTAVVRTAISATRIDATLRGMQATMAWTAVLVGLLVFLLIAALIKRFNRPLEDLKRGAERFSAGDLRFRLAVPEIEEVGSLAETLNAMAVQLSERIDTILRQRNEQQAVLSSMVEGVIAIDAQETIIQLNPAASVLIGMPGDVALGRSVREMIRNPELQKLTARTLARGETAEGETVFYGTRERSIQVHVTALLDAAGTRTGALIVLNDVTNLRRLERVRQDFVANVSHELKTPLTSIKGFVETLREGAIDQPAEARRFLEILEKQVDRLHAILEDLLALSRIEQGSERGDITLEDGSIEHVLRSAVQICAPQAVAKNITIEVDCPDSPRALINTALLEQAAVNLIDNAIKYSEPGRALRIEVRPDGACWALRFIDQGCGIEAQHLDRVFERFYRVDKARSRKEGGTGLGLSIVKHIMAAHGGHAAAESTPGQGSVFTLFLPYR